MAEVLRTCLWLVVGGAIGWFIRRRTERRVVAKAIVDGLAAEWAEHTTAHLKAQDGSVVMTAPTVQPLTEGYVRKGGRNPPPTADQLARRPQPPAPFRPAR